MDFVYFVRHGENEELRYSIRSVIKHFPDAKIWVLGNKPDWYTGNFVPIRNIGEKFTNIANCCYEAARHPEISDPFVWMNDDFFIMKPLESILPLHRGSLKERADRYAQGISTSYYNKLLHATYSQLVSRGIEDPLDYDVHMPLVMDKEGTLEALKTTRIGRTLPRSMYGNLASIGGSKVGDVKVYSSSAFAFKSYDYLNGDFPYLSTEDSSFEDVCENVLKDAFPDPSPYEK